jgi:perosamine synthetase
MNIFGSLPFFSDNDINDILREIKQVLESGRLIDGPYVQEFERKFAEYNNVKHAVAVNSCTTALEISLRYFKLNNQEVIVPTNTFISTPNSVIFAGGRPVFADINEDTLSIDIDDVKKRVTSKTIGIIVVHIAGLICPQIDELKKFCEEKNLFLLEDCAHAHGAMMDKRKAGTFGDAGCFSFYPTKVMTSCQGGMLVTNNSKLAEQALCRRTYGQNSKKQSVLLGNNWVLNEMVAVVGTNQLENLENFLNKRNKIAGWYQRSLSKVDGISLFKTPANFRNSYYKFPIKLTYKLDRRKLGSLLKQKFGVETGHVYFPPCHMHPIYYNKMRRAGNFPVAEKVLEKILCLPMHYGITEENVEYISDALISCINMLELEP